MRHLPVHPNQLESEFAVGIFNLTESTYEYEAWLNAHALQGFALDQQTGIEPGVLVATMRRDHVLPVWELMPIV